MIGCMQRALWRKVHALVAGRNLSWSVRAACRFTSRPLHSRSSILTPPPHNLFFLRGKERLYYSETFVQSWAIYCSTQAGTANRQTAECRVRFASWASSCATQLLSLFVWITIHSNRPSPANFASSTINFSRERDPPCFCKRGTNVTQSVASTTREGHQSRAHHLFRQALTCSTACFTDFTCRRLHERIGICMRTVVVRTLLYQWTNEVSASSCLFVQKTKGRQSTVAR